MSKQLDPLKTTTLELHPNKTVIIVGDSWSCGEWKDHQLMHKGLEQYLINDGYRVINKGIPGNSNFVAIDNLSEALARADLDHKQTVAFFFCTDWQRDITYLQNIFNDVLPHDVISLVLDSYDNDIAHRVWHKLFSKLEKIASSAGVEVGLIGGCTDTITVGTEYSHIYVACESMTKLCLGQTDWTEPVLSLFNQNIVKENKTKPCQALLNDMDLAVERLNVWKKNPEWFWPDGSHANRDAHWRLFDFLKEQNLV